MSDIEDRVVAPQRRLFLLQFLVKVFGSANDRVLLSTLRHGGFEAATHDDLDRDLAHLRTHGLIRENWLDDQRKAILTERGEDVAHGRVRVEGVEHSIWRSHDAP